MTTTDKIYRPYKQVHALLTQHGGTMTWRPMGAGGDWVIELHGKTAVVRCRNQNVNALDHFYVAKVSTPETWDDYDPEAPLREGAFWNLINLLVSSERA